MSFILPTWEFNLPVDQRIIDFTYSHTQQGENWTSNSLSPMRHLYLMEHECFQNFVESLKSVIRKKLYLLNPIKDYELDLYSLWLNLNWGADISIQRCHIHYPHIAGTYYLKAPKNCGDLLILNPHQDTSYGAWGTIFNKFPCQKQFEPKEGSGVFFPSWTPHQVLTNTSGEDRLSLAFGFELRAL